MEYFTVKQISELRNVSLRAIYSQIANHKEELKPYCKKENGKKWYSQTAVNLMIEWAKQNPPTIVEVENKTKIQEHQQKYDDLESEYKRLQGAFNLLQEQIESYKKDEIEKIRLEYENKYLLKDQERAEQKISDQESKIAEQTATIAVQAEQIRQNTAELDRLKHRSLIQRILNK